MSEKKKPEDYKPGGRQSGPQRHENCIPDPIRQAAEEIGRKYLPLSKTVEITPDELHPEINEIEFIIRREVEREREKAKMEAIKTTAEAIGHAFRER